MGSAHEVSAVLQTLLNEGALMTNIPSFLPSVGKWPRGRYLLSSEALSSKPSESPTVTQP